MRTKRSLCRGLLATIGAVALVTLAAPGAARAGTQAAQGGQHPGYAAACPAKAGAMHCLSEIRINIAKHLGVRPHAAVSGYGPADLRSAYKLPSSGGSGRTVAIVDAYDDPNAQKDMSAYRSHYGLPACTSANGCFEKVNQNGKTSPLPKADSDWGTEISLDLDMVSAVCPSCHILLVEANTPDTDPLGTSVDTAVKLGAKYVSNSYGGSEEASQTQADKYFDHPGVAVTASSGDDGYGVEYPAASRYVTAVGGTTLNKASNSRGWSESAWNGSGSGCSSYDAKPSWQKDSGCAKRTVADVSAVADPNTGVAVYDSYGQGGWLEVGGTSASSPIIASVYALAGTPASGTIPASYPYAHTKQLNDVTTGNNFFLCSILGNYLCQAGAGYDGPTGLGTPNGTGAFAH